jgi:hypothetical protein
MAVSLKTLTSLVLTDLGLPLFLKASHNKKFSWLTALPEIRPDSSGRRLSVSQSLYSRDIR